MEPVPPGPDPITARDISLLRQEVMSLNRHMQRLIREEVEAKTVPREELGQRLRASAKRTMVAIIALGLALVLIGGFVLNQRRNADKLRVACEGRNAQSRESKKLLDRFAVAEIEENKELAADYRTLARSTPSPEGRRLLIILGELELKRDRATSTLFRELSENIRIQDCTP